MRKAGILCIYDQIGKGTEPLIGIVNVFQITVLPPVATIGKKDVNTKKEFSFVRLAIFVVGTCMVYKYILSITL